MATQTIVMTRAQINAAIAQAALASKGIDPNTAGLVVAVQFNEEHEVMPPQSWRINVTVTTP